MAKGKFQKLKNPCVYRGLYRVVPWVGIEPTLPKELDKEIIGDVQNMTFHTEAMDYLKELEDRNKLNTLSSDRVKVRHVLQFAKSKQLRFQEIDEAFLRRFAKAVQAHSKGV